MTRSISELQGLGPSSEALLESVGIQSADAFLKLDPFEVYVRIVKQTGKANLNLLYALIGAHEGVHWQRIKDERKVEILMRLDDLGLAP